MLLVLTLLACDTDGESGGDDSAPASCFDAAASVQIGGSDVDGDGRPVWTEMPQGSGQVMVHGPQGGWHLLASADVGAMEDIVTLVYTVEWPSRGDVELSRGQFRVLLVANEAHCGGTYAGMYGVLDVKDVASGEADTPPELLAGEELRIRMVATDGAGRSATDTRLIVAELDPQDVNDSGA